MRRIQQVLMLVSFFLILALATGCGPTLSSGGPADNGASPTPTAGISPSPTATPPHSGSTGPVTLHTSAAFYKAGDTITVNVNNRSSQTIYFPDHQTNCTVVLLQREKVQPQASDNGQDGINPCPLDIPTRMHSLGPGASLVVKLVAPKNGWLVGLYHATLSYRTSPAAGSPVTISSNVFTIGPLVPQP